MSPALSSLTRSFRFRATVLFGALTLAAVAALSWRLGDLLNRQLVHERGEAIAGVARATALLLAEGLHERQREVELLAGSREARRLGVGPAWRPELERLQRSRDHFSWIGVAGADGRVLAATGDLLLGQDVSQRPWFQAAQRGPYVGDVHPAKLLESLLPARADAEPIRFIDFAAPLRDEAGRTVGILAVHADWRWARDVIAMVHHEAVDDAGLRVYIVDREGRVIHRPAGPPGPAGDAAPGPGPIVADLPALQVSPDGTQHLSAAAPVRSRSPLTDLGWTVVARQPAAVALAGARAAQQTVWVSGAVAALASMLLAWVLAARFSRPLAAISQAATRIEGGELAVHIPQTRHTSELEQLSVSLGRMTEHLVQREQALVEANRRLEARVAERTAALTQANRELDQLAHQDGLTGLLNRRGADQLLVRELAHHRRHQRPLAVLLADIDHFKRVNDHHGHAAGDAVLHAVAQALAAALRASDVAARFGGEEFVIVLRETGDDALAQVGEKLRAAVAALVLPVVGRVTLSLGGCVSAAGGASVNALLRRADEALYDAKGAGRNRVVIAPALD